MPLLRTGAISLFSPLSLAPGWDAILSLAPGWPLLAFQLEAKQRPSSRCGEKLEPLQPQTFLLQWLRSEHSTSKCSSPSFTYIHISKLYFFKLYFINCIFPNCILFFQTVFFQTVFFQIVSFRTGLNGLRDGRPYQNG